MVCGFGSSLERDGFASHVRFAVGDGYRICFWFLRGVVIGLLKVCFRLFFDWL